VRLDRGLYVSENFRACAMDNGRANLPSRLRSADTALIRQYVLARALAVAHQHARQFDCIVDSFWNHQLSIAVCLHTGGSKSRPTDQKLASWWLDRRQGAKISIRLPRNFGEGMV